MRLSQTDISGATQIKTARPLRYGAFNPSPLFVPFLESGCRLSLTSRLEGQMLGLGQEFEPARCRLPFGAARASRTSGAILRGKTDMDDRFAKTVVAGRPGTAALAPGTRDQLG